MASRYRRPWSGKQAPDIRRRLLARDGPWCARCGLQLPDDLRGVDISHAPGADVALNPVAAKRLNMFELQLEHRSCNRGHGARLGNALRRGARVVEVQQRADATRGTSELPEQDRSRFLAAATERPSRH